MIDVLGDFGKNPLDFHQLKQNLFDRALWHILCLFKVKILIENLSCQEHHQDNYP